MASALSNKSMELEGNLGTFALPDVLRFLSMGKLTGVLNLHGETRHVRLWIKDGNLIGTGSHERFLKLGQLLIYNGVISPRDLEQALREQQENPDNVRVGEVLIESGRVTSEQVQQSLALQMKEELWELFSWVDGNFRFEHGASSEMDNPLLTLEIEPLIEEGSERMQQWREIANKMNNPEAIFAIRPDTANLGEVRLKPSTWRVLSLINGHHNVEVLIHLSGLGRFETLCAVDELLALQLIEQIELNTDDILPAPVAQPAPAEPRADLETPEARQESRGGLRRIFGFARREDEAIAEPGETPQAAPKAQFSTGVQFACSFLNEMLDRLSATEGMGGAENVATMAHRVWHCQGLRFARADLIQMRGGRFDAALFERYVELAGGLDDALNLCLEDSLEALSAVGRVILEEARVRVAETTEAMAREMLGHLAAPIEIAYPPDFTPNSWARQWCEPMA